LAQQGAPSREEWVQEAHPGINIKLIEVAPDKVRREGEHKPIPVMGGMVFRSQLIVFANVLGMVGI
jgi:hypothetical protein